MKLTAKRAFASLGMAACLSASMSASAFSLKGTVWDQASSKVDPRLLYAIALAESRKTVDGMVRPWPWAVNVQGKGYFFDTQQEAEDFVDATLARGIRNMDVGPLQINVRWNGHRIENPKDLFHLPTAVRVGADILAEAMSSAPHDKALAVGRYHNWQDEVRARQYGRRVLKYLDIIANQGAH